MSATFERRYARLLRLYPAEYRRVRGAEVLETLRESAESGHGRPAVREFGALILGALRARAGQGRRQSVPDRWLVACRAAVLLLLGYDVASQAVSLGLDLWYGSPSFLLGPGLALELVAVVFGGVAGIAVLRARYLHALVAASVAAVTALTIAWSTHVTVFTGFWTLPQAAVLLVPLLRHRPPAASGLIRFTPVLALLLVLNDQILSQWFSDIAGILQWAGVAGLLVGGLLWLAVDERVAMAVGLLLLNNLLIHAGFLFLGDIRSVAAAAFALAFTGVPPAALLLASGTTAWRRARI